MIKIKICSLSKLKKNNYFVRWVDKIKDEIIVFKVDKATKTGSQWLVEGKQYSSLNGKPKKTTLTPNPHAVRLRKCA